MFHTHTRTQLCHTPSFTQTHTQLCHTLSFTHITLSHTIAHSLSHTLFHIQLCHTLTLRGRHGTWKHPPSLCVAGVALGDIHFHLAWQASRFRHWAGSGGALGAVSRWWRSGTLRGRCGTCGTGLALVVRLGADGRRWHRGTLRGRRGMATSTFVSRGSCGTWRHWLAFCVAGVALGDIDLHFAWQTGHLQHWAGSGGALGHGYSRRWRGTLRVRRGTWRHPPSFRVAGVALGDTDLHFAWQASRLRHWNASGGAFGRCKSQVTPWYFAWQAWYLATSTFVLRGRRSTWWHHVRFAWQAWRGTWRHWLALCVAGVALGDPLQFCGAGVADIRILFELCVAGVALGDIDVPFAWQVWYLWQWAGTWWHSRSICVACVALRDINVPFAWQACEMTWNDCGPLGFQIAPSPLFHGGSTSNPRHSMRVLPFDHRWGWSGTFTHNGGLWIEAAHNKQ